MPTLANFDRTPCENATLSDLNNAIIASFLSRARASRDFPLPANSEPVEVLTHLSLLVEGHPSNAAILLFGRKPQAFFKTATIKCHRSPDSEEAKRPLSSKVLKGTVFHLVDRALDFILSAASGPAQLAIPVDVVREAVANSVAHRDYTIPAGIDVTVFDDRLEIWNPGTPPPSLTIDALRRPHESLPRNPLIAKCLYLARYSERIGTGTRDMIMTTRGVGLPVPQFAIRNNGFLISLFRR